MALLAEEIVEEWLNHRGYFTIRGVKSGDLESIHRFSSKHRDLLGASELACCFYCKACFSPAEIDEWIDGRRVQPGDAVDGATASVQGVESMPSSRPQRPYTGMTPCWTR